MGSILNLARKDLMVLFRDRFALFWIFAFPLMFTLFFGAIFGSDGGTSGRMGIVLVDEDGSADSRAFLERLADHDSIAVAREAVPEGQEGPGAPVFGELEAARSAVRKGDRVAYVRVLEGYGASPFAMFEGGEPKIEVGIDPSRSADSGFLQGVLMETLFGGMGERFGDREFLLEQVQLGREEIAAEEGLSGPQKFVLTTFMDSLGTFLEEVDDEVLAEGPFAAGSGQEGGGGFGANLVTTIDVSRERGDVPHSTFEVTFPQAMVWGLMSVALGFAVTFVRERTQGTLLRLQIAPLSAAELFAGKACACFAMCMIVLVFLQAFGAIAMGVRLGPPVHLLLAMVCTSVCFTGLMMTAAVMGKTEQSVAGASWGMMMPFAMIGGGMIPLIAMPPWLVQVSGLSPFKWGILAIEGAIWRGFTLGEMMTPCAVLLGFGLAFFALGTWVFRRMA